MSPGFDPDRFQVFEMEGWQRKAGGYTSFYAAISRRVIDDLLDSAGVGPGADLVDIGTGPGWVAAAAAARGARVLGIDISSAMVEIARMEHPGLAFEVADAQQLRMAAGSVDAVTGNFALHHLPRQAMALEGFRRVLRRGGKAAFTAWGPGRECRFLGLFTDAVAAAGAVPPPDLPAGPPMVASDEEYGSQLAAAGFERPEVRTIRFDHVFPSAEALWSGLLGASVRTAALITGQDAATRALIRTEFDRLAAAYWRPEGLRIPVSVKLFSGAG